MGRYLLRRLLIAVPSLLGISLVLFTVLALAPGDPFGELATNPNVPPEVGAALRAKFGLDDPIMLRYVRWLTAMLHGDWGFSFVSRINVDSLILQRLPATLLVIGSSQILALLIALPARHGLVRKRRLTLDDLEQEPFILMKEGHCLAGQALQFCRLKGFAPRAASSKPSAGSKTMRSLFVSTLM